MEVLLVKWFQAKFSGVQSLTFSGKETKRKRWRKHIFVCLGAGWLGPFFYTCKQNDAGWTIDQACRTIQGANRIYRINDLINVVYFDFLFISVYCKVKCDNIQ